MKRALLSGVVVVAVVASACGGGDANATKKAQPTGGAGNASATRGAATTGNALPVGSAIVLENPTVTPSGLKYVDQVVGTGASPRSDQMVTVHYTGKLAANGQKFDSSVDRGQPATFAMNGVIPGFSEALATMKVGGKRTAQIPAALGYGAVANAAIPANSDLIFEIELISIR